MSDVKTVYWETLNVDLKVKIYDENEAIKLLKGRTYRNEEDYKWFVISQCVYGFTKLIKSIRSYCLHYSADQKVMMNEVFQICANVNPIFRSSKTSLTTTDGACNMECQESEEPTLLFSDVPQEEILALNSRITEIVLGQDEAIAKVVNAVQRASAGLKDPKQPIGSFLLTGPTGVGKTYFAKKLAEVLTGNEDNMIRIDCSEYKMRHEYAKLIGSPPGYAGCEQGGILTNAIKKKPFAVVLFDEIEKAHDNVFNLLLQIMDEGTLTSNMGVKHSFRDAVILMTSNLGVKETEKVSKTMGFGDAAVITDAKRHEAMERALAKKFKPEFLNRIDEFAHFMPLDESTCRKIVVLELDKLTGFLKENRNISVNFNTAVVDYIHSEGFDPIFGARPLRRCMKVYFANPLATSILRGEVEDGDSLTAYMEDGEINFK